MRKDYLLVVDEVFYVVFVQFSLPVTWTHGSARGMTLEQMVQWWSTQPAKLVNLPRKVLSSCSLHLVLSLLLTFLVNLSTPTMKLRSNLRLM